MLNSRPEKEGKATQLRVMCQAMGRTLTLLQALCSHRFRPHTVQCGKHSSRREMKPIRSPLGQLFITNIHADGGTAAHVARKAVAESLRQTNCKLIVAERVKGRATGHAQ
jgi:hypothetical protein